MNDKPKESNAAVRRVCRILRVLQGHALEGLSLAEITAALKEPNASTVLRTLEALAEESMVIKGATGRWMLSVLMLQIAAATEAEINRKSLRLAELKQRIGTSH
jgi:DNA-binding transcriptional MerR regulator